jgi:hypothetical protein
VGRDFSIEPEEKLMIQMTKIFRAALLSALLAATVGTAAPVHAQGFTLGFGFGIDDDDRVFPRRLCILTDRGIREAIRDEGYRNIYLNAPVDRYIQARATKGNWVYLLKVNLCTGDIVDRERLRRS